MAMVMIMALAMAMALAHFVFITKDIKALVKNRPQDSNFNHDEYHCSLNAGDHQHQRNDHFGGFSGNICWKACYFLSHNFSISFLT